MGNAHNLLLVKHHAKCLFQNRLKSWVQILNWFAVPAVNELRYVFHWSRSVEGNEWNEVLKFVWSQIPEKFPPPALFHLKDADSVTFTEHRVSFRVVKGQIVQVNLYAVGFLDKFNGTPNYG